ncbi:basic amino acid ABC transporter substrate-binding protein [Kyrpidia spormannii]|uniref:Glutamine transporter subunit periplasmic binding component of ABC superfamily n=1 Tax=Kyrpidia spormannii TaxID=2055160 RepID=A0A6F9DZ62_9BACL|nr:basic amino acid ABC transporter substrate-binding protein [Kyrpidia spormannii]CAB3389854.1 glutamine transporter subunit; periplasmic binding component of ABC superfamily [Kyrpidia spormannii]
MRRLAFGLGALVLGLTLAGCGTGSSTSSSNGQSGQAQPVTLHVGADTTFPPFETEKNGQVTGFDIDLIKAIAQKENMQVDLKTMDFQGLIPALQTGDIDVAVAGITITDDRKKSVNFSDPYYHSGLSILVKKDNTTINGPDDLTGKTVAVKLGTTADLMFSKKPGVNVKRFTNISDAYSELQNGGADAVVFDNPVNLNYIRTGHDNVKIVGPLLTGEDYGIAVRKNAPDLLQKINDGLKQVMADGTYDKLYQQYFGDEPNGKIKH